MSKNRIIKLAMTICKIILVFHFLFGAIVLLVAIHWHFSPSSYESVEITRTLQAHYGLKGIKLHFGQAPLNESAVYLSELNHLMVYWLVLRAFFFIGLNILIIRSVIKILRSIQNLNTFYNGNIIYLKNIAKYGFFAAVFSCFNISYVKSEFDLHLSIPFVPLILVSLALVLAEVFREGKILVEDKNLII